MASKMKTALLVVDMQAFFEPMTTTALPNIITLSKHFTNTQSPQFFTQHGHPPSDFAEPITNQLIRKWGLGGSIRVDSAEWALMPEIAELQSACKGEIVPKNTYDAFWNTGLEEKLREADVQRVVICGVMTDCCCDTSGRSAFNRGFETWMVGDATGSVDKTQHEAGLKAWGFGYGEILSTEEVVKRLS